MPPRRDFQTLYRERMRALAAIGGRSRSAAKVKAARRNIRVARSYKAPKPAARPAAKAPLIPRLTPPPKKAL